MDGRVILAYLFGIVFLFLIGRAFHKPLNLVLRLLLNAVAGGLVLWGLNLVGRTWAVSIPVNPFTALVAGFLGIPGVAFLLVLKYLILP